MSAGHHTAEPGAGKSFTFQDRLLADAVRVYEQHSPQPIDDSEAVRLANVVPQEQKGDGQGGDFEIRIIRRAVHMPVAAEMRKELRRGATAFRIGLAGVVSLGLLVGAGAARVAIEIGRPADPGVTNIFAMLLALLGIQSVLLLLWFAVTIVRPHVLAVGSVGGLAAAVLSGAARIRGDRTADTNSRSVRFAVLEAVFSVLSRRHVLIWLTGLLSHGFWLAFNVGAVLMLLILLTTRQYTFTWETTILSDRTYSQMTHTLAALPGAVGIPTPSEEQVAASQWPIDPAASDADLTRRAWSGFLIGCLLIYGLMPRGLLVILCAWRWRGVRRAYRLPLDEPGFAVLQRRLDVDHRHNTQPGDAEVRVSEVDPVCSGTVDSTLQSRPPGDPVIVGLELSHDRLPALRDANGRSWQSLGNVDGRDALDEAVRELAASPSSASPLLVVAELQQTPDRGLARALTELRRAAGSNARLLLTGGDRMRRQGDGDELDRRIEDWRSVAVRAGYAPESVRATDLDHLTDASQDVLMQWLTQSPRQTVSTDVNPSDRAIALPRRLESVFDSILEEAGTWDAAPDVERQAALFRKIAEHYKTDEGRLRDFLIRCRIDPDHPPSPSSAGKWVQSAASGICDTLPARLRKSARWAAAGALAGALGGVAAAVLIWPPAVAAIPSWSALGASIGALTQLAGDHSRGDDRDRHGRAGDAETDSAQRSDLIRSAALYAVLLELQGRDESAITRMLDATFNERDPEDLRDIPTVRKWLEHVRHRFDLAITAEAGS